MKRKQKDPLDSRLLRDLVLSSLEAHPWPWSLAESRYWRIVASDGYPITEVGFKADAEKLLEFAKQISEELEKYRRDAYAPRATGTRSAVLYPRRGISPKFIRTLKELTHGHDVTIEIAEGRMLNR